MQVKILQASVDLNLNSHIYPFPFKMQASEYLSNFVISRFHLMIFSNVTYRRFYSFKASLVTDYHYIITTCQGHCVEKIATRRCFTDLPSKRIAVKITSKDKQSLKFWLNLVSYVLMQNRYCNKIQCSLLVS